MAPEVLNACGKIPYDYSADGSLFVSIFCVVAYIIIVYALGMVMYELMTLEYPFYECESPIAIASAVIGGKQPIVEEDQLTAYEPIIDLWVQCLSVIPSNRPTASEVRDQLLTIRAEIDKDRYRKRVSKLQTSLNSPVSKQSDGGLGTFSPVATTELSGKTDKPDFSAILGDENEIDTTQVANDKGEDNKKTSKPQQESLES